MKGGRAYLEPDAEGGHDRVVVENPDGYREYPDIGPDGAVAYFRPDAFSSRLKGAAARLLRKQARLQAGWSR